MARAYTRRRTRGEGAVYETKDGRWRACLVLTHPDTGKVARRFVSGRTRAEAVANLDKLRQSTAGGFSDGRTAGEFLAGWVVAVRPRLRPSTHREYVRHVTEYFAPLHGFELAKLTPGHVERAMTGLTDRGLSPQTVRSARSSLRRALQDAHRDGLVTRNVASLARPPRLERRELGALSPDEVRRLLAETVDDAMGPLWAVAVGSGLRRGELLGLRWPDIDMNGGTLTVRRAVSKTATGTYEPGEPKTPRSRRTVNLAPFALDALRRQRVRQAEARLAAGTAWQDLHAVTFTDAVGRPLEPSTVSNAFHDTAVRLGLDAHLHTLRHTSATLMLLGGAPLKVVSDALGHSSIAVTADVYAHVTPDLRREAADALDRALR